MWPPLASNEKVPLSLISIQIPQEGPSNTCIVKYQEIWVAEVHRLKEEALTRLDMKTI